MKTALAIFVLLGILAGAVWAAADHPKYGPELEGFDYPYEVQHYKFTSQGIDVQMVDKRRPVEHDSPRNIVVPLPKNKNNALC